jgi:hypothetical protein
VLLIVEDDVGVPDGVWDDDCELLRVAEALGVEVLETDAVRDSVCEEEAVLELDEERDCENDCVGDAVLVSVGDGLHRSFTARIITPPKTLSTIHVEPSKLPSAQTGTPKPAWGR